MDTNSTEAKRLILILDALDECDRDDDIKLIIHLLSQLKRSKNISLKVFLMSRPELPIRLGFNAIHGKYKDIALHEIPDSIIFDDIASFLKTELSRIRSGFNGLMVNEQLPSDWPGPDVIRDLCKMAVPLFIFAATVCRFIGDPAWADPAAQLEKVLMYQSDNNVLDRLDATYLPVLNHLIVKSGPAQRPIVDEFRIVVGSIVVLAEPLSPLSLSSLLDIPKSMIDRRLRTLHSVLSVPISDEDSPIRMLHLSFRDFLLDPEKRDTNLFWVDEKLTHRRLYESCIKLLSSSLKQNICNLEQQGTHYKDIPPSIISSSLPQHVQYACVHWVYHLIESGDSLTGDHQAYQFLQTHLLHWVESLSLLGKIHEAISMLRKLRDHAIPSGDGHVTAFLHDATRFFLFFKIAGFFPLQLYSSAMIFSPHQSLVKKRYQSSIWKGILQAPQVQQEWDSCLLRLEDLKGFTWNVVFSPDGKRFITASKDDGIVVTRVWDTETGAKIREYGFPMADASSSIYNFQVLSPCGQRLAMFEQERVQFSVKNVMTGEEIIDHMCDFEIRKIIFSDDGCVVLVVNLLSCNALLVNLTTMKKTKLQLDKLENPSSRSAVLSPDQDSMASFRANEVWIFNLKTGKSSFVFKTQSGASISDLKFTPGGKSVAAIGHDSILYVWDLNSAQMKLQLDINSNPQDRKMFPSYRLICLEGRSQIISANLEGGEFRFWDSETGELQKVFTEEINRSGEIDTLAFSPDGSTVAIPEFQIGSSTSPSGIFRICDTDVDGANHHHPERLVVSQHLRYSKFTSFHPGCLTLVNIYRGPEDRGMVHERLLLSSWGTQQKLEYPPAAALHSHNWALSSDGLTMAILTDSKNESLWLWNISTAYAKEIPWRHNDYILGISFSSDDKLIATASGYGRLRLWDVVSSNEVQLDIDSKIPNERPELNPSIGFSPDSKTVILVEHGNFLVNLHIWNVVSGSVKVVTLPDSIVPQVYGGFPIAVGSNERIALISSKGELEIWEVADSTFGHVDQVQRIPLSSASCRTIVDMSFTSDNRYLKTNLGWISILPSPENRHIVPFFLDEDWLYRGGQKILWIPPDYRSDFMAWHEYTVALRSSESGLAIFIVFNSEIL